MRLFHVRLMDTGYTKENKCGVTLALRYVDNKFLYGLSVCSPKDQFSKKIGRLIATGRLEKKPQLAGSFEDLLIYIKDEIYDVLERQMCLLEADALCGRLDERVTIAWRKYKRFWIDEA